MKTRWLIAASAALMVGAAPVRAAERSTQAAPPRKPVHLASNNLLPITAVGQGEAAKEEEKPAPKITYGASADFYFSTNFNDPWNGKNSLRAFDIMDEQGPHLGLIDIWAQGARANDELGWRIDLNFGPTAHLFHALEPSDDEIWQHVQQLYVSANLSKDGKTYIDFGKWNTTVGAEVLEPKDNWLYTRGILFNWAQPFFHAGARIYHYVNDTDYYAAGIHRGWNAVSSPNHDPGFFLAASKTLNPKLTVVANYYGGEEYANNSLSYRSLIDLVALYNPSDKMNYTFNFDYVQQGSIKWYGLAAQAKRVIDPTSYVAGRFEWVGDEDGAVFGDDGNVVTFTLGYTKIWNKYTHTKVEYRHDIVGGANLIADERRGTFTDDQGTFTISQIFQY